MRLAIFATHPVQYHVPLWRALARQRDLDVKVFYFSDHSIRGGLDVGFGVPVAWDVDLLSGYEHVFLSRDADLARPAQVRVPDLRALLAREVPDWALISGYTHGFEWQLAWAGALPSRWRATGMGVLMRGEFSDGSLEPRSRARSLARSLALRAFYSRVDRFCYPGAAARGHLLRHGVPADALWHSPYSVDDRLIAEQRKAWPRDVARKALQIPDDHFVFVLSGKLIARKDPLTLVHALQRMPRTERVWLLSLGDGELRAEFDGAARAVLGTRLVAPGFVNQSALGQYFAAADALVMPSRFETWGLVVNEAMHHGLCVLTSDRVGCHPDLVLEGETGHVFAAGDAAMLAARMQALVDGPQRARAMGQAAAAHAQGFTIEQSARGVVAALGLERAITAGP